MIFCRYPNKTDPHTFGGPTQPKNPAYDTVKQARIFHSHAYCFIGILSGWQFIQSAFYPQCNDRILESIWKCKEMIRYLLIVICMFE